MIETKKLEYEDLGVTYEGVVAYDSSITEKRPIVMICHAYGGQNQFEEDKALALAKLGYVGFAIDVYGKGVRGSTPEESTALMNILTGDRRMLLDRLRASLAVAKGLEFGDADKVAAIGFCFGGMCVLDIARSGERLKGVASFHGVLNPSGLKQEMDIVTPILVLHGWDDPLATPTQTVELAKELTDRKADWEINAYGLTGHSFTNPKAQAPEDGMAFSQSANDRSWNRMKEFLSNIFEN